MKPTLDSFEPNSSSSRLGSPRPHPSSPSSPPDSDGWQKPSKGALHLSLVDQSRVPKMGHVDLVGQVQGTGFAFKVLGSLEDTMELGRSKEPSPRDLVMSDPGCPSLKWARSPSKALNLKSDGPPWVEPSSEPASLGANMVSPSFLCLVVE